MDIDSAVATLVRDLRWGEQTARLGFAAGFRCEYCGKDLLASIDDADGRRSCGRDARARLVLCPRRTGSMAMWIWRWLFAPFIGPLAMAPIMILTSIVRPLQALAVFAITLAYWWTPAAALVAGALYVAYYAYDALTPPKNPAIRALWLRNHAGPGGQWGTIALNAGIGLGTAVLLVTLPEFNVVLRWILAVFFGYYAGGVLAAYVSLYSYERMEESLRDEIGR